MNIQIDSKHLIEQLRFDLMSIRNFDEHIKLSIDKFMCSGYGSEAQILASIRTNRHFREMYRARIIAVLELLEEFNEDAGDMSDTENLECIINALEQNVI